MQLRLILSSIFLAISLLFIISHPISAKPTPPLNEPDALNLGVDAYIYGYPLVTMEMTRRVMTNVATATNMRAPMGQFANVRTYPDASFRDVTAPNADTLYSVAWLDLTKEPYILQLPNENGRYYLMPMLSGWTNVFAAPGKRTTGTNAQTFIIVGPEWKWKGKLPDKMRVIQSPTNLVWLLGRTYADGSAEDYKVVHALQDQYQLTPLSAYGKTYIPPRATVNPKIDMKTPVRDQVNQLNAEDFFKMLAELMKTNPPAKADAPIVAKLAKLNIVPGKDFDINQLNPEARKGLESSVKIAQEKILAHAKNSGKIINGWVYSEKTGNYGTDYLQRAYIAWFGLGANLPQDAIYPSARVDSDGKLLNGANQYKMHFAKGELPPVNGFWSLTMYDQNFFFVNNPLNRYTLSERNALKTNADGSVDLYLQHESPGADKESNWLPAPAGDFVLMLRLYWPKEAIINGSWKPPVVERIK